MKKTPLLGNIPFTKDEPIPDCFDMNYLHPMVRNFLEMLFWFLFLARLTPTRPRFLHCRILPRFSMFTAGGADSLPRMHCPWQARTLLICIHIVCVERYLTAWSPFLSCELRLGQHSVSPKRNTVDCGLLEADNTIIALTTSLFFDAVSPQGTCHKYFANSKLFISSMDDPLSDS